MQTTKDLGAVAVTQRTPTNHSANYTSVETIEQALSFIPADDRDTWIKCGMAIKAELGDAGFDSWDRWSSTADSYRARVASASWRSFKASACVGIGTLFFEAQQYGFKFDGTSQQQAPDPAELAERQRQRQEAEEARHAKADQAAKQSAIIWDKAQQGTHAYCENKQIAPAPGRMQFAHVAECKGWFWTTNDDGELMELTGKLLLLPLYSIGGELRGLQAIDESSRKSLIKGLGKQGLFIPITGGKLPADYTRELYIGEGFATAATVRKATSCPAVAAIDAGNLIHVARAWRQKLPHAEIIIAGDLDKSGTGQKKSHEAALAVGGLVALPPFTDEELAVAKPPSDWNDYAALHGVSAVKLALENLKVTSRVETQSETEKLPCSDPDAWQEPLPMAEKVEPEPLRAALPPAEPYPVDMLGSVLGGAANALHDSVKAPLAMCCQSVLAAASLAAQPHYDIKLPWGERKPLSLFLLTVGESGERKSGIDDLVLGAAKAQERADMEVYAQEQERYEAAMAAWNQATDTARKAATAGKKGAATASDIRTAVELCGDKPTAPVAPLRFVSDPTVEGLYKLLVVGQPSVALFSDEGGLLIGGHAMNSDNALKTMARWCKLWDGSPFDRVRAGDGAGILYGRRMALHQLAQPDVMTMLLSDRMANGQGLLARCLVAWPESTIGNRHVEHFEWAGDRLELKRLYAVLKNLMEAQPRVGNSYQELDPVELPLSDDAKALAVAASNQFESLMAKGADLAELRDRAAKALENACRIAGVLAVVDGGLVTRIIEADHLQRALVLTQWYLKEALRIRGASSVPQAVLDAEMLSAWLKEKDIRVFRSKQVLNAGPNPLRNKPRLLSAIAELVTCGYLAINEPGMVVDGVSARTSWRVLHHVV